MTDSEYIPQHLSTVYRNMSTFDIMRNIHEVAAKLNLYEYSAGTDIEIKECLRLNENIKSFTGKELSQVEKRINHLMGRVGQLYVLIPITSTLTDTYGTGLKVNCDSCDKSASYSGTADIGDVTFNGTPIDVETSYKDFHTDTRVNNYRRGNCEFGTAIEKGPHYSKLRKLDSMAAVSLFASFYPETGSVRICTYDHAGFPTPYVIAFSERWRKWVCQMYLPGNIAEKFVPLTKNNILQLFKPYLGGGFDDTPNRYGGTFNNDVNCRMLDPNVQLFDRALRTIMPCCSDVSKYDENDLQFHNMAMEINSDIREHLQRGIILKHPCTMQKLNGSSIHVWDNPDEYSLSYPTL